MQHCVLKTFCRNANHVVFVALLVQNASQKRILKMSTPSTFSWMEGEYFNLRYSAFRCSPLRGKYSHSLIIFRYIFSNYWMRLSRIWRILQIKEGVIHRGRRPRWITPSEICRILDTLRKPHSIIALLFIQNIYSFLKEFHDFALCFSAHQI